MSHTRQRMVFVPADLVGVGLALLLLSPLTARLEEMAFVNSIILGLFFLLFCLAVYALKKLAPVRSAAPAPPVVRLLLEKRPLTVLGVVFALVYSLAIAYAVGFLDSVVGVNRFLLDEPAVTVYLLLTPASWFGLSLIYMLLLSGETEETVPADSGRYGFLSLLGLSGINLMGVALAAVGSAVWARVDPAGGSTLVIVVAFLLYLLLLGPPRLIYQAKQPRPWWLGLVTFIPLLLYLAWSVG